jgi:hypothetical protein
MLTPKDQELFESISRNNPGFRLYLVRELEQVTQVLIKVMDMEQMRRAQGKAQQLQTIIDNLDGARAVKRL